MRFFISIIFILATSVACTRKETQPPQKAKPAAKALGFDTLTALSTTGVDASQLKSFVQFANEEVCPCDCPKSFAGCLQTGSKCQSALILGQWIVDRLREGVPFDMIAPALTQEVGSGFAAQPAMIDVGGYASKGSKKPTFTLVEFADFQCAHCQATSTVLSQFIKKNPQIQVVFKHFPLPSHPMAKEAAIAAEAASRQGKFWQMHDALFSSTQPLSSDVIDSLAKKIGLNFNQFKKDITNPEVINKVTNSMAEGKRLGITGTPAIFINGKQYFLSLDESGLNMRLKMEAARSNSSC